MVFGRLSTSPSPSSPQVTAAVRAGLEPEDRPGRELRLLNSDTKNEKNKKDDDIL